MPVLAIRGAITVENDAKEEITSAVLRLVGELLRKNCIGKEDIVSIIFSVTPDIHSMYPATALRLNGFEDVVLFGTQEMLVKGALEKCIRVLMHIEVPIRPKKIFHVYLEKAKGLRDNKQEGCEID